MSQIPSNPENRDYEKRLEEMSPFEIKGTLISLAEKDAQRSTATFLNAGRGNPNWLLSFPRMAFFLLGQFAVNEASRTVYDEAIGIATSPCQEGVAGRFEKFLKEHADETGAKVLNHFYTHFTKELKADPDELVFELVDGILGDHYPTPPRILKYTEIAVREYLRWAMGGGNSTLQYDLFATEGSTAGMCYIFDSLKQNFLMKKGDKLALFTPCFTPYIEIPQLDQFGFDVVYVSANKVEKDGYHDWQYPPEELDKLRDPAVKAVCITNPSNPPSYTFSQEALDQIVDIVKKDNPDLMIITDDVYGTFISGFKSLMYVLPYNTCCLYSFSKYFGATGWRVATMALAPDNVFDARLQKLSADEKAVLNKRYESLALEPEKVKFVDRLVADSRLVGLNHTAGLSTPQQIQMALFAAFAYLHHEELQPKLINMIHARLDALWSTTGFTLLPDPYRAGYYSEIDLMVWAKKFYGQDFADYLTKNYEPLDFVIRLANETAVVLLNGDGFDGPKWSVRASLANLNRDAYLKIGTAIRKILDEYHANYLKSK
ncbi:MAG: bifunctional aspartate transaminase/aspartate 4-decarboxylase [Firmicutes bacterium]|nr:bifunctional aspartate transaminase/aspartate 4-decarboxylase [Bacillota bacterium]MCM1400452.1 bifunctional aspartate transaminase/aspartate 4-decarboxylase [Bacteroides sp.]MCM1476908.1 bifunctional aspartate transaminase/aspartate 4-decarboxylase [Bacteroides sp.]